MDLDTMLSKIDARLIENVVIIKGPYSVLYGPGFDFVDLQLLRSPRYETGPEGQGAPVLTTRSMASTGTDGSRCGPGQTTGVCT